MLKGLIGRKLGMTQIYHEDTLIPVTVLELGPCTVTAVRTPDRNGYSAVQVGYGAVKEKKLSKPLRGQFAKVGVEPRNWLVELPCDAQDAFETGQTFDVSLFSEVQSVDISGRTKGRGFAGNVKRHGFAGGPKTHGSKFHRAPGSIGACAWPSKVVKGKRMAGHYGDENFTVRNLKVVQVDAENNLLYVKGAVPGAKGGRIVVRVRG